MLNEIDKNVLKMIADIDDIPAGAVNIRKNGAGVLRKTTKNIDISSLEGKEGIFVEVRPNTIGETVHIPVIVSKEGMNDIVYNTFEIGEGSDVTIVAGCGIHTDGCGDAQHDGVHTFHVGKNAKMKYAEKHYGEGTGTGKRILNPKTIIDVEENGVCELEMIQIRGVDDTVRDTIVNLGKNARLIVTERLLTYKEQTAQSDIIVNLKGDGASAQIISRSVAQNESKQVFHMSLMGYAPCRGHIQCDSIIMDGAEVRSIPEIGAFHSDAQLIHEAAIGKIASEQMTKLMALGLDQEQAEEVILNGFLK